MSNTRSTVKHTFENKEMYTDYISQIVLLLFMLYPWFYLVTFPLENLGKGLRSTPYTVEELYQGVIEEFHLINAFTHLEYMTNPAFLVLIAQLSIPHIYYYLICSQPKSFYRLIKPIAEPYKFVSLTAWCIKFIQWTLILKFFFPSALDVVNLETNVDLFFKFLKTQSVFNIVFGFEFFFIGQLLNSSVYKALGEKGVYYGAQLGHKLPWVVGFPFTVVSNAQYLGSVMTYWGVIVLVATEHSIEKGLYGVGVATTLFYIFSSYVESSL